MGLHILLCKITTTSLRLPSEVGQRATSPLYSAHGGPWDGTQSEYNYKTKLLQQLYNTEIVDFIIIASMMMTITGTTHFLQFRNVYFALFF